TMNNATSTSKDDNINPASLPEQNPERLFYDIHNIPTPRPPNNGLLFPPLNDLKSSEEKSTLQNSDIASLPAQFPSPPTSTSATAATNNILLASRSAKAARSKNKLPQEPLYGV